MSVLVEYISTLLLGSRIYSSPLTTQEIRLQSFIPSFFFFSFWLSKSCSCLGTKYTMAIKTLPMEMEENSFKTEEVIELTVK